MAKKLAYLLAGLLALTLTAALALRLLISPEQLTPLLKTQLEQSLNRKVSLGNVSLSLWPLGLAVDQLSIADDPRAASTRPFATADTFHVQARLLPLLSGNVEIESLRLHNPTIELIKSPTGAWNYETLGAQQPSSSAAPLRLGAIHITGMQLAITKPNAPRALYKGINLTTGPLDPSRPLPITFSALNNELTGTATLNTPPAPASKTIDANLRMGAVQLTAKGALTPRGPDTGLHLDLTIPQAPIASLAAAAAKVGLAFTPGLTVQGNLAATIAARGTTAAPQLSGNAQLSGLEISGGALQQPIRASRLQLEFTPSVIRSQPFELATGNTRVNGLFVLANYSAATPRLDATTWAEQADLAALLRIAQAYGLSAAQGMSATGDLTFRLRLYGPLGSSTPFQIGGTLASNHAEIRTSPNASPLTLDNANIKFNGETGRGDVTIAKLTSDPFPLTNLSASLLYRKGVATLDPVRATLYDGLFTGAIIADTNATPTRLDIRSHMEKVDSERLIAAATPLRKVLTGALFSNADLRLSAAPAKADLARSLNGNMTLKLTEGKLLAMSVLGEVAKIAQFLNRANPTEGQVTPFLGLTGDIQLTNGLAQTDNLLLNLDSGAVLLTGTMDLAAETLNLKMVTTLNSSFSNQVGGNKIGGYLTAAIQNQKGELVIPAQISGTFSSPRVTPDPAAMAKLKLGQILPGLTKPGTLNEGLKGVLDIFKGQKKQ